MKLLHTMVRVKDLERSARFYRDVLGLRERRRRVLDKANATLVFFGDDSGEQEIELTYNHDGRDYQLGTQYGHMAFAVEDLDRERRRLEEHGITFSRGPYRVMEGGSRIAFIKDPDGMEVELIEESSAASSARRADEAGSSSGS